MPNRGRKNAKEESENAERVDRPMATGAGAEGAAGGGGEPDRRRIHTSTRIAGPKARRAEKAAKRAGALAGVENRWSSDKEQAPRGNAGKRPGRKSRQHKKANRAGGNKQGRPKRPGQDRSPHSTKADEGKRKSESWRAGKRRFQDQKTGYGDWHRAKQPRQGVPNRTSRRANSNKEQEKGSHPGHRQRRREHKRKPKG